MVSQICKIAIRVSICIYKIRQIIITNLSIKIIEVPKIAEVDKLIILILIKLKTP